jgi:hypothetical protein
MKIYVSDAFFVLVIVIVIMATIGMFRSARPAPLEPPKLPGVPIAFTTTEQPQ